MSSVYHQNRQKFYQKINDFWPDLYGEEYALYDIYQTDKEVVRSIHQATERIGHIFYKTAKLLRQAPDETLIEMGFPSEALSFLRSHPIEVESVIARLDLVQTGDTFKCLEINSDTPTFIKEVFSINEQICQEFNLENPNHGMENKLSEAVRKNILQASPFSPRTPFNLVFTSHQEHIEDCNTSRYLQKLANLPARYIPLDRLKIVRREGLYDEDGHPINILYRQTFPIENLLLDRDAFGQPIGLWLLELVELGKLAIINPPSAFLLQNKAVQAVIWGLHETADPFFTKEEHEWIAEYFLPSYLEAEPFLQTGTPYVKKPVFGREGDTVQIYDETGKLKEEDSNKTYLEYLPIYQQFVDLPVISYTSEKGYNQGHMIIGSFLIDGKAGGIGCRVGEPITNNFSYFLPIGIKGGSD